MLLFIPGNPAGMSPILARPGVLDRCGWLLTPHRRTANTGLLGRTCAADNECYAVGVNSRPPTPAYWPLSTSGPRGRRGGAIPSPIK